MAERLLILAPRGRDGAVICQVLERAGIASHICDSLHTLLGWLDRDACGVLVTEEALAGDDLARLLHWIEVQAPWSDLPVIVLATRQAGPRGAGAAQTLERLGNVVLLERPINAETLLSAARSVLRARRRQYEARSLLLEREQDRQILLQLNESLEQRVAARTAELEAARDRLDFALDSAGMGSWDLDLATDQSRCSIRHDRIFGFEQPPSDWGRARFLAAVVEEDRDGAAASFAEAMRLGTLDLDCRIDRPDGRVRWIAVRGRVEHDAHGTPTRMAGIVMDATDRRLNEEALHQAQKMEAIGQLTGGVAHDFNNLLTVIVGALDMVIRRPERTDRVARLAEAAMTAAQRGEQLTRQLLAFSRRQMLRPETVDPGRLLSAFATLARRAAGEAIDLAFDLDHGLDPIRVDPAQFEAAILNLIVNARDAMPDGGTVTVGCRNLAAGAVMPSGSRAAGPMVLVSVTDTGTGFEPLTLAHAFEPFFTTKEVGKGSGLGLSQVYGFARSAGGDVAIESAPGRGTVVRLTLPSSDEAPAVLPAAPAERPALSGAAGRETVLLVEDDEQVRGMAIESLEELRYHVLVSRNADEALEHLGGQRRIDVLFSDVVMPGGMNGAQLAVEAQRLRPGLKILLTSGYVGEPGGRQLAGRDLPMLSKPYRRDELARTLRAVLEST